MSLTTGIGFLARNFLRPILFSLFVFLYFFTALSHAVEQHSPTPFLKEFVIRAVSADQENRNIAISMEKKEKPPGFFASMPAFYTLFQILNIIVNGWFVFRCFTIWRVMIRGVVGETTPDISVLGLSLMFMGMLHIIGTLFFMGPPATAAEYLHWIPFSGTVYALMHLTAFLPG